MNREDKGNHSFRVSMVELILVIGIFTIVSVFLVKIFLETEKIQQKALNISKATIQAEFVAEKYKNSGSIMELVEQLNLIPSETNEGEYYMYFDTDWNQINDSSNRQLFVKEINNKTTSSGNLKECNISVYFKEEVIVPIFTVNCQRGVQ